MQTIKSDFKQLKKSLNVTVKHFNTNTLPQNHNLHPISKEDLLFIERSLSYTPKFERIINLLRGCFQSVPKNKRVFDGDDITNLLIQTFKRETKEESRLKILSLLESVSERCLLVSGLRRLLALYSHLTAEQKNFKTSSIVLNYIYKALKFTSPAKFWDAKRVKSPIPLFSIKSKPLKEVTISIWLKMSSLKKIATIFQINCSVGSALRFINLSISPSTPNGSKPFLQIAYIENNSDRKSNRIELPQKHPRDWSLLSIRNCLREQNELTVFLNNAKSEISLEALTLPKSFTFHLMPFEGHFSNIIVVEESVKDEYIFDLFSHGPNFSPPSTQLGSGGKVLEMPFAPFFDAFNRSNKFCLKSALFCLLSATKDESAQSFEEIAEYSHDNKASLQSLGSFAVLVYHLSPLYCNSSYSSERNICLVIKILLEVFRDDLEVQMFVIHNVGLRCIKTLFIDPIPPSLRNKRIFGCIKQFLIAFQNLGHFQVLEGIRLIFMDVDYWKHSPLSVQMQLLECVEKTILSNPTLFFTQLSLGQVLGWILSLNEHCFGQKNESPVTETRCVEKILSILKKLCLSFGSDFLDQNGYNFLVFLISECNERMIQRQLVKFAMDLTHIFEEEMLSFFDRNFGDVLRFIDLFVSVECAVPLLKFLNVLLHNSKTLKNSENLRRGFCKRIFNKMADLPVSIKLYTILMEMVVGRYSFGKIDSITDQQKIRNKIALKCLLKKSSSFSFQVKVAFCLDLNVLFYQVENIEMALRVKSWGKYFIAFFGDGADSAENKIIEPLISENLVNLIFRGGSNLAKTQTVLCDFYVFLVERYKSQNDENSTEKFTKILLKIINALYERIFSFFGIKIASPNPQNSPLAKMSDEKRKNIIDIFEFLQYAVMAAVEDFGRFEAQNALNLSKAFRQVLEKTLSLHIVPGLDPVEMLGKPLVDLFLTLADKQPAEDEWTNFLAGHLDYFTVFLKLNAEALSKESDFLIKFARVSVALWKRPALGKAAPSELSAKVSQLVRFSASLEVFAASKETELIEVLRKASMGESEILALFGALLDSQLKIGNEEKNADKCKGLERRKLQNRWAKIDFNKKISRRFSIKNLSQFDEFALEFEAGHKSRRNEQKSNLLEATTKKELDKKKTKQKISYFMEEFLETRRMYMMSTEDVIDPRNLHKKLKIPEKTPKPPEPPEPPLQRLPPAKKAPLPENPRLYSTESVFADTKAFMKFFRWFSPKMRKFSFIKKCVSAWAISPARKTKGRFVVSHERGGFFGFAGESIFGKKRGSKDVRGPFSESFRDRISINFGGGRVPVLGARRAGWLIFTFRIEEIKGILPREAFLTEFAAEIFFKTRESLYVVFENEKTRNNICFLLAERARVSFEPSGSSSQKPFEVVKKWQLGEISNFNFIVALNALAGRSFKDVFRYPVFPWVLCDYSSEKLELGSAAVYRDLSKPVGALNPERAKVFRKRYKEMRNGRSSEEKTMLPFHYGTLYSSVGLVLHYLVRLEPFTTMAADLYDGKMDVADRIFHSLENSWKLAFNELTDVKELLPEFYCTPEIFRNQNRIDFGISQDGAVVNDVVLPPWAKSAEEFVDLNRKALESDFVSKSLNHWVDLIFGYKQSGPEAVKAQNVFFYLNYPQAVDLESIKDADMRKAYETQILNFGRVPQQILKAPCPPKLVFSKREFAENDVSGNFASVKTGACIFPKNQRLGKENLGEALNAVKLKNDTCLILRQTEFPKIICSFLWDRERSKYAFCGGMEDNSIKVYRLSTDKNVLCATEAATFGFHHFIVSALTKDISQKNVLCDIEGSRENHRPFFMASGDFGGCIRLWKVRPRAFMRSTFGPLDTEVFLSDGRIPEMCCLTAKAIKGITLGPIEALSLRSDIGILCCFSEGGKLGVVSIVSRRFVSMVCLENLSSFRAKREFSSNSITLADARRDKDKSEFLAKTYSNYHGVKDLRGNLRLKLVDSMARKFVLLFFASHDTVGEMFVEGEEAEYEDNRRAICVAAKDGSIIVYYVKDTEMKLERYTLNGNLTHYRNSDYSVKTLKTLSRHNSFIISGELPFVTMHDASNLSPLKRFSVFRFEILSTPDSVKSLKKHNVYKTVRDFCALFENKEYLEEDFSIKEAILQIFRKIPFWVSDAHINEEENKLLVQWSNGEMSLFDLFTENSKRATPKGFFQKIFK